MKPSCLLIAPPKYYYKPGQPERIKYHLLSLMSHVADVADVEILDLELRFGYPSNQRDIDRFVAEARGILAQYRPDVVGVSAYTSYDYLASLDVLRLCRSLYPDATLVVGGYHATAVPGDFTSGDVPVDYVIRGEGENVLRALLVNGSLPDGPVIDGSPLVVAEERPLRYDRYPGRSDDVTLALSRGCPYSCSFCVQSDDFPNPYRRLSIEQVRKKLSDVCAHGPIRRIMFIDPFFGLQPAYTAELLRLLRRDFKNISFWAETRVDRVSPVWFAEIKDLRLDLHFGVESLAPDTLRLMRKAHSPEAYIEGFHRTLQLCRSRGILARCGFIMNYPGELPDSYRLTVAHIRRALGVRGSLPFTFHCNQYALYPGNDTYKRRDALARERGFEAPNDGWWRERLPNARHRSEQCTASRAMREEYGPGPGFWKKEILELQKSGASRFTFKAFCFFRTDEIFDSLKAHYSAALPGSWADESQFADQRRLLRRFRYLMSKVLACHQARMRRAGEQARNAVAELFNLVTFDLQRRLLESYDRGMPLSDLLADIETRHRVLLRESRGTTCDAADAAAHVRINGEEYRVDSHGALFRRRSPVEAASS